MQSTTPSNEPRIAVVGPGSVGLFFAGHLAAAGRDVVACARRPFDRYVIESETDPLDHQATVVTDPDEIATPVEWVLFCVKAHQSEGARGWLERLCDEHTRVVVVQNGIEHDRIAPWVNGGEIVPSVVYCGGELLEPGHMQHHGSGHLIVEAGDTADELVALFEGSRAEIRPKDDLLTPMWLKLSLNVMANGLTALTRRDMSVFGEAEIQRAAIVLLKEVWAIARAEGAQLEDDRAALIVEGSRDRQSGGTSMYYDTMAGRPTEHDAIHGAALRKAAEHRIDVPAITLMHALLEHRA